MDDGLAYAGQDQEAKQQLLNDQVSANLSHTDLFPSIGRDRRREVARLAEDR